MKRRRQVAMVLGGCIALGVVGAAGAFWYTGGRWGCPSNEELRRARSAEEVVDRFEDEGVTLLPLLPPPAFTQSAVVFRDATALGHSTDSGTLLVILCRARCAAPDRHRTVSLIGAPDQTPRQISVLGNNLVVVTADDDRRSGRRLQKRAQPAIDSLDAAVEYGSRCYIN